MTDSEEYDSDDEQDEGEVGSSSSQHHVRQSVGEKGNESDTSDVGGGSGGETCAICLGRMKGEVGSPEGCDHSFCLDCILEWARVGITKFYSHTF